MKVSYEKGKEVRIEMIPLIDMVFLLLVFFIYAMLSMAVHRALPVVLPTSSTAQIDKRLEVSVTLRSDGTIYVEKELVDLMRLSDLLAHRTHDAKDTGVLLFADRSVPYQELFAVLDRIRTAGIHRISLQAEKDSER